MTETGELTYKPTLARLTEEGRLIKALIESEDISAEDFRVAIGQIEGAWLTTLENIGHLLLDWNGRQEALDNEIARLKRIKEVMQNREKWLKEYTLGCMVDKGDTEWQFPLVKVTVRNNPPSVEVIDESDVPARFTQLVPATISINKNAIREYWKKTGEEVTGTRMVTDRKRLEVK